MWILLPAEYISKKLITGCKTAIFQSPKIFEDLDASQLSLQFLQDFESLLSSSKHSPKPKSWSMHSTTISKLRSFLPPVLSETDLSELDPQQSNLHSLPSLIFNELRLHNQQMVSLHALLELMASCLSSKVTLTAAMGQDILLVASDTTPLSWFASLPKPLGSMTSLMSAMKLLRARIAFYRRILHSGTLPSKLNPLLFSCPQDLISSRTCNFAAECQHTASDILTEGRLHVGDVLEKQVHGLVLFGLGLNSASWDQVHSFLVAPRSEEDLSKHRETYCAVISFKLGSEPRLHSATTTSPAPTALAKSHPQLECPVVLTNRSTMTCHHSGRASPTLFTIPLPISVKFIDRNAYLSCDGEYHDAYM